MNLGLYQPLLLCLAEYKQHGSINSLARSCHTLAKLVKEIQTELIKPFMIKNVDEKFGIIEWILIDRLHSFNDQPAYVRYCYFDGKPLEYSRSWYKFGKLHRDVGPAVEKGGGVVYYKNGKRLKLVQHETK